MRKVSLSKISFPRIFPTRVGIRFYGVSIVGLTLVDYWPMLGQRKLLPAIYSRGSVSLRNNRPNLIMLVFCRSIICNHHQLQSAWGEIGHQCMHPLQWSRENGMFLTCRSWPPRNRSLQQQRGETNARITGSIGISSTELLNTNERLTLLVGEQPTATVKK